eukprot:COSAG04_NODE_29392_length_269_cov_0.711765_1_plen_50_part_01
MAGQPAMGHPEGSRVAALFYDTLLDQHEDRQTTKARGRTELMCQMRVAVL